MSRALKKQTSPRFTLRRDEAAASLSASPTTCDKWVYDGRMPKARKVDRLTLRHNAGIEDWVELRDGAIVQDPLDATVI